MARLSVATESEIRASFERVIDRPQDGIPSDAGFDDQTTGALMAVVEFLGEEWSVKEARAELERQFDGEHAKEDALLWKVAASRVASDTKL